MYMYGKVPRWRFSILYFSCINKCITLLKLPSLNSDFLGNITGLGRLKSFVCRCLNPTGSDEWPFGWHIVVQQVQEIVGLLGWTTQISKQQTCRAEIPILDVFVPQIRLNPNIKTHYCPPTWLASILSAPLTDAVQFHPYIFLPQEKCKRKPSHASA